MIRPQTRPCSEIDELRRRITATRNLIRMNFPIPIPCPELAESIRDPLGYQQRTKAKQLQGLADDVHELNRLEAALEPDAA